jgi:Ca2+-binding EF-hand superfamily protein
VLLKAFKYFDTDGSGECSPAEFKKALEKIGITFPNDKELNEIFKIYDSN